MLQVFELLSVAALGFPSLQSQMSGFFLPVLNLLFRIVVLGLLLYLPFQGRSALMFDVSLPSLTRSQLLCPLPPSLFL